MSKINGAHALGSWEKQITCPRLTTSDISKHNEEILPVLDPWIRDVAAIICPGV